MADSISSFDIELNTAGSAYPRQMNRILFFSSPSSRTPRRGIDIASRILFQLPQTALQKTPLRLLRGQAERPFIRVPRFVEPPEAAAEVRAGGVGQVVVVQLTALENGVDLEEARLGRVAHRNRDGAIELGHGRRRHLHQ